VILNEDKRDVLAFMKFSEAHLKQIVGTKPRESANAQVTCRTDVFGISGNEAVAIGRLGRPSGGPE